MRYAILITIMALLTPAAVSPQTMATVALRPESGLWLDGGSNLKPWTCKADELDRSIRVGERSEVWEITQLPEPLQRAELRVPVRTLRCGNRMMERDLYRAVRAEIHPQMTFRLYTYEFLSPPSGRAFTVRAVGVLGLAGREQVVRVDARVERLSSGLLRLRGRKSLRMTDFGIEPPTAMLGLIKAHDGVAVRFDLVVDPRASDLAPSDTR